jgi:predicted alpha/beta superfamily hydrolase
MVEFVVRVPDGTPPGMRVFVAGDGPALGHWSADAVPLDPWDDGTHRATRDVPPGSRFLVTLGRWRLVESSPDGERPVREVFGPPSADVTVQGWGRGSIRYHHEFKSRFLRHPRTVSVYLPPGYDREPAGYYPYYPVMYLQDGQNLFDPETAFGGNPWWADEVAERVIRTGEVRPVILVGVANTPDRLREYGPRHSPLRRKEDFSHAYGRFLREEVMPFINHTYRTLLGAHHTAVGGSSMGALIALHLCKWYPGAFGMCAALSPSLWWDGESFLRRVGEKPGWLTTCRVWLDTGDREGWKRATQKGGLHRVRRLAEAMREYGVGDRLRVLEVPGGEHSESSWGARFDEVLRFLFGASV